LDSKADYSIDEVVKNAELKPAEATETELSGTKDD
jgi:hypothetical protein